MEDIVISYETLFELLRIERSRTDLQELPNSYFKDIVVLIDSELATLDNIKDDNEKLKKRIHVNNVIKIVNELYERREKKIVNLALNKSKAKSSIVDFSKFLKKEKDMFLQIVDVLDNYRFEINSSVLSRADGGQLQIKKSAIKNAEQKEDSKGEEPEPQTQENKPEESKPFRTVRFLSPFPRFLGEELEVYGPFDQEEIVKLPSKIVSVLVAKKRAEEIRVD